MLPYHYAVENPSDALVYLLDCSLATVERMAMKKNRIQSEYKRQIGIAQKTLDWCVMFHTDISETRAAEIVKAKITVEQWAVIQAVLHN